MFTRTTTARLVVATLAVGGTLLVAACGNDNSGASMSSMSMSSSATVNTVSHNDSDVTFLQMMYPHHAQAVEMAKLVPTRTTNQAMLDLASAVQKAQAPEMDEMTALLKSFGQPAPSAGDMSGMNMGSTTTPGMMSADQMNSLTGLSGAAFDKAWLTMMIDHHTGAIDMARTEQAKGINPDAKKLADSIVSAQQAEITHMQQMLHQ